MGALSEYYEILGIIPNWYTKVDLSLSKARVSEGEIGPPFASREAKASKDKSALQIAPSKARGSEGSIFPQITSREAKGRKEMSGPQIFPSEARG